MIPFLLIAALIIAFASSSLLVPVVRRVALGRGWVDKPDLERKNHERPTPNVGGLAIVAGFAVGLFCLGIFAELFSVDIQFPDLFLIGGAISIVMVGFYDDVHGLSFKRKFVFQLLVAYMLLSAGYRFDLSGLSFLSADPYNHALISIPITMIWIVGIINAVNLLDGLDGLASGISIIAFAALAIIFGMNGGEIGLTAIAVLTIGAIGGFLVFNFNPASIFMGDSGSLFLGYMLAAFSLSGPSHGEPILSILVPAVALGLPILDTGLCMVRRLIDGISPFAADSDHIHHRLSKIWPTRSAVLVLYAVAIWFGIASILISQFDTGMGLLLVGVTVAAAIVGIRTLGYLNLKKILVRKTILGKQLSFMFAEDIPGPTWSKRSPSTDRGDPGNGSLELAIPDAYDSNGIGDNGETESVQIEYADQPTSGTVSFDEASSDVYQSRFKPGNGVSGSNPESHASGNAIGHPQGDGSNVKDADNVELAS